MRRIGGRGAVRPCLLRTADTQWNRLTGSAAQNTDPAEIYFAVAACSEPVDSLQISVRHLQCQLSQQHGQGCIAIEQGPFAGDPDAAVAVATESLRDARLASRDIQTAIERAHMALADLAE